MNRILEFFRSLPPVARYGIPAVAGLLVLALVVGVVVKPAATPATVSTVRPAASPASISGATAPAPAPSPVAASTAPAAPPAAQTAGMASAATVVRPAMPPRPLRACAREVLGIANADAFAMRSASYTAAAEREDCKSPFASVSPSLAEEFAPFIPGRGYIQVTRSGIYHAAAAGEHTFVMSSPVGSPRRCALYVGDLTAPLVEAESYKGQFAAPAVAALEAGQHEVAIVCGFAIVNSANNAAGVSASVRAPGEAAPVLMKLNLPEAAAAPAGAGMQK